LTRTLQQQQQQEAYLLDNTDRHDDDRNDNGWWNTQDNITQDALFVTYYRLNTI